MNEIWIFALHLISTNLLTIQKSKTQFSCRKIKSESNHFTFRSCQPQVFRKSSCSENFWKIPSWILYFKRTPSWVFSWNLFKNFKNSYSVEHEWIILPSMMLLYLSKAVSFIWFWTSFTISFANAILIFLFLLSVPFLSNSGSFFICDVKFFLKALLKFTSNCWTALFVMSWRICSL